MKEVVKSIISDFFFHVESWSLLLIIKKGIVSYHLFIYAFFFYEKWHQFIEF